MIFSFPFIPFIKVCLIEQKSTKKVLAMKYVNKEACVQQGAVQNVTEEVELLREVDHPFVVSLWYTFQVSQTKLFCTLLLLTICYYPP